MATSSDDRVRNGEEARKLADGGFRQSDERDLILLATLAAAHAELGDFKLAIELQEKALKDKQYAKSHGVAAKLRLEEYRNEKPHRESWDDFTSNQIWIPAMEMWVDIPHIEP